MDFTKQLININVTYSSEGYVVSFEDEEGEWHGIALTQKQFEELVKKIERVKQWTHK